MMDTENKVGRASSKAKANSETVRLYVARAFYDMRRSLREAESLVPPHPHAQQVSMMRNPLGATGEPERVMSLSYSIAWCVQYHVPTWSANTWRLHRLGYRQLLSLARQHGRVSQDEFDRLHALLASAKPLSKKERVKKTSATRKKNLSLENLSRIEEYFVENTNHTWGDALLVWLKAAVVTGLRPNEWTSASISNSDDRIVLTCKNSKFNEDRSYAPFRTIDLTNIPGEWLEYVRKQLAIIDLMRSEGTLEQHYRGCSSLLLLINRKVFPHRKANIHLYTSRHQFAANAKSTTCSDEERAAMMGHKTTKTAVRNYGKGRHGSHGLTPEIADKSVLSSIKNDPSVRTGPGNAPLQKK